MVKWQDEYIPTCMLGCFLLHMEFLANKMFGGLGNNIDDNGEVYLIHKKGWPMHFECCKTIFIELCILKF